MSHIENEYRKWGDDYDAEQILGDIEDMPAAEPLTAADLLELEHRFGRDVREVVEDMLKGEGKRWQST
jgi:hypothetical protein